MGRQGGRETGKAVLAGILLGGLLGAAGCAARGAAPPSAAPAVPLSVMTFNIRYGTADDGADSWPLRRDLLLDVLRAEAPDLLGLQEALRGQLDEIRAALPRYGEVGVGRDDGVAAGEYAAILYDRERLELLGSGHFWFSDTPEVPGSATWGNRVTRICTWARFLDRASGRTFTAYDLHLDHESQNARERSAALLLWRIAAAPPGPVLVTGDFNAGADNPAVRTLLDSGLVDSWAAAHPRERPVGTYHAFRGDTTGEKIDFILVSPGWRVADAAIVRTAREGRWPSDHFPVIARLVLAPRGADRRPGVRAGP